MKVMNFQHDTSKLQNDKLKKPLCFSPMQGATEKRKTATEKLIR